jgi:iron(III) transport system permease protein
MLPLAMPAMVLGLGYLWTWTLLPLPLYGTLMILSLAFVSRFAPQGVRSVSASINQISPDLEAAARVGGAGRLRSILEIIVPLMRTGLGATMLMVFILSIRELSVAIFLYSPNSVVLSILVFNKWVGGSFADAATISLLYSLFLLLITLAGRRWLEGAERA